MQQIFLRKLMRTHIALLFVLTISVGYGVWKYTQPIHSPAEVQSLFREATEQFIAGKYAVSMETYERIFSHAPAFPVIYLNYAKACINTHAYDRAIWATEAALSSNIAQQYETYLTNAIAHINMQQYAQAGEALDHALYIDQKNALCWYYKGLVLSQQKKLSDAYVCYKKAALLDATKVDGLRTIGQLLRNEGALQAALAAFDDAIALDSPYAKGYLLRADVHNMLDHVDAAIADYKKAASCDNALYEAYHNLGMIYAGKKADRKTAQFYFEHALRLRSDSADAHLGIAGCYLGQGDYERGFAAYEWRTKTSHLQSPQLPKIAWDGSSVVDKTVLIYAEQGLGDFFHFIRYANMLHEQGARIMVHTYKPLKKIISLCPYIDEVTIFGEVLPAYDVYVSVMSLPYLCRTTRDTIPAPIPYLYADASLHAWWHERLMPYADNIKVGVCWHVDPHHDADFYQGTTVQKKMVKSVRSIPFDELYHALSGRNVRLFSLQKGPEAEEIVHEYSDIVVYPDLDTDHGSFMDTAALMHELDLVITADTSVAHLAGALGIPVWVLIPYASDWRWGEHVGTTPWYPTMRLFRQTVRGSWREPLAELERAFAAAYAKSLS